MNNLTTVKRNNLATAGQATTFTIAEHTGISRTTLYRNPINEHRQRSSDPRTLLTTEIAHLRTGLKPSLIGRQQEERLRRLETSSRRKTS